MEEQDPVSLLRQLCELTRESVGYAKENTKNQATIIRLSEESQKLYTEAMQSQRKLRIALTFFIILLAIVSLLPLFGIR